MKTAIVFGGSSGFGRGIVDALNSDSSGGWYAYSASRTNGYDVRSSNDIREILEAASSVDAVIYSAGLAIGKNHVEIGSKEAWQEVFDVNVLGLLDVARQSIPYLRQTEGHLISIGSIAYEIAYAGGADYCASKAAQRRVMETLRLELLGSGIRQTAIEPGLGDTEFQARRYDGNMALAAAHYGDIRQLTGDDMGRTVRWILDQPRHVNIDSLTIKPLDQAHHGHLAGGRRPSSA